MEIIRSFENKKVKHVSKLKDKSYREETAQYFAEGVKWVTDALKIGTVRDIVDYILVKESKISEIADNFGNFERVFGVADGVFDKISETKNSQGVLAVLNAARPSSDPSGDRILYLDRIRDPGNMGTLIRTALAADYLDIICDNCVDVYNPKVIRSCMSAVLHVNVYDGTHIGPEDLKRLGYKIAVADAQGANVFDLKNIPGRFVLVIGNEAEGVRDDIFGIADMPVSIPMNKNIESLNAAVSAAVLMYELKK